MRINTFWHAVTISGPERPKDEVRALRHRILREPKYAAMLPLPVSGLNVIRMVGAVKSRLFRLLSGKISSLTFCDGEKVSLGLLG